MADLLADFKNTNVEDIRPEVTLELTESNSNQRCLNICDQKGFKYAGVQKGPKVCFCSDEHPPEDLKYPADFQSECPAKYRSVIFRTGLTEIDAEQSYKGCYKLDDTVLNKKFFML
ncbi:Xylosyltransferase 2 [Sarracenia purpurea var. burkii]